jgi:hypothetical protein
MLGLSFPMKLKCYLLFELIKSINLHNLLEKT